MATLLVDIAEDLYTFGCTPGTYHGGELVHEGHTWAAPKLDPEHQRPLADIRPDLAAVFKAQHGRAPGATALGDAMTVLEGKARAAEPAEATPGLLALLGRSTTTKTAHLIKLARDSYRFGVTVTGDVFAVPLQGPNIARPLRGGRRSLRAELARQFYAETKGTAAPAQALADALLVLEGDAASADPEPVALRAGQDPATGDLVLDLGRDDGLVAVISASGWRLTTASPVLFWRTNAMLPLPVPDQGGSMDTLRGLINLPAEDWPLAQAVLVASLFPSIPHPVLGLFGEHGTAKSTTARLLTSLIDPCASQLRTVPRSAEDWAVACAASWVTCLDNVSHLQSWLQDAICRACTGDGLLRRELYTNSDVAVLAFRRAVVITGIDPGPLHGDLASRLLAMEPGEVTEDSRKSEQDIDAKWQEERPKVLGALLGLASGVLGVLPGIRSTNLPRMADFARVVLAADKVLGTDAFGRYLDQARGTAEAVADSDPVIIAIREHITSKWEGTASALLAMLTDALAPPWLPSQRLPKDWPTTPQGMGGRLVRAAPVLRRLGWEVSYDRQGKAGTRTWTIKPPEAKETPPGMSAMSASSATSSDLGKQAGDPADMLGEADVSLAANVGPKTAGQTTADMADISAPDSLPPVLCKVCHKPLEAEFVDVGFTAHPACELAEPEQPPWEGDQPPDDW
jgi:hypothetical protein